MNKLPRLGTLVVFGGLVGACAQIIGLNKFDEDEPASAGESGDSGKGGNAAGGKATGGSAGSNVSGSGNSTGGLGATGGSNGGSSAGGRGGSTGGDAGMAGAEGGTGALGGGGGQGGTGGKGGSAGKAGAGGTGGSGGSSGELGCSDTIEITTAGDWTVSHDGSLTSYSFNLSPQLTPCSGCQGPLPDYLWIDFYTGGEYTGAATGDFMLGVDEEENYASCSRCVWLGVEFGTTSGGSAVYYFSTGGEMVVDAASDHINDEPLVSLSDVTLEEVTIDFNTGLSTPVNGGRCLHLASASLTAPVVTIPPEWTCDDADYLDTYCDCGCGAVDRTCGSGAIGACDYCPETGCAIDTDCHEVDLVDATKCTGPQQWLCKPNYYGDGSLCDCGCGIVDLDCESAEGKDCDFCDDPASCTAGNTNPDPDFDLCTLISATDNSQCQ
jgi:hypothetical protein